MRAIFDNASTLVPGEDVKVAGVPVGRDHGPRRDRRQEGRGHAAHRRRGLHPLEARRAAARSAPQGLIGEKFVDCQPGSSSAPAARRASTSGDGEGERLLPVEQHQLAGGPRPAQRHHAAALPAALRDPAERVRHRPRGPRRGAERGHPPRQPGAARDRQGAEDPRRPEPHAGAPGARLRPGARRRSRASASTFADFIVQANATGEASAERRGDLSAQHPAAARLPARAAAADGGPRGLRRPGHAAAHAT